MDIQEAVKRMRQADVEGFNILNLGQIIEKLEDQDPTEEIMFDFGGFTPDNDFCSYRGSYDELAIGFEKHNWRDGEQTVGQFLEKCKECIGKTFHGYKGGEFTMDESTPVWASQYGEASSTGIVDIKYESHFVLIETKHCES